MQDIIVDWRRYRKGSFHPGRGRIGGSDVVQIR